MSTLSQPTLFCWHEVDRSRPILMLERTLDALPDASLLETLARERRGRRDEYPQECLWRALVAGALLGHTTRAALIAELRRNSELRQACRFDPARAERAVPSSYVFSRFVKRLMRHQRLIDAMFETLVERVGEALPDLGRHLAVDSKALVVRGRKAPDALVGTKTYETVDADGTVRQTHMSWKGYKLHLLVDARYELPLRWEVTEATRADSPRLMPLLEKLAKEHRAIHERAQTLAADKGYDDGADKADLFDHHGIVPLIPPRDLARETRYKPLDEGRSDSIYLGPTGQVCCKVRPFEAEQDKAYAPMQFQGFEPRRATLKFRCPAAAWGLECQNREACRCRPSVREGRYGRVVRIPLERDRRVFLPIHVHSRTFHHAYKRRTAVERVNSRLDRVHGLEWALVDSRQAMTLRVSLALIAMLASAAAWIEAQKPEKMRLLLRAA